MAIRNFDVVVTITTSTPEEAYRVSAAAEIHGQATETLPLPTHLLSSGEIFDRETNELDLESSGTKLFQFLLGGSLGALFSTALGQILSDDESALRLRLRIEPPELAALPWELAFDPLRARFLAASPRILVSRHLNLLEPVRALETPGRVRLLVVIPEHSGLETEAERRALEQVGPASGNRVDVLCVESPVTIESLRAELRKGDFHVIHFAGHADLQGSDATLLFDGPRGAGIERLEAKAFARLLEEQDSLRLVVLNACRGAARSPAVALAGIAPQLLRHRVPAVLAMQSAIRNSTAMRFASEFYASFASGRWAGQVERAVCSARRALLQQIPNRPDFANPVLYLRAPDGMLWDATRPRPLPEEHRVALRLPQAPFSFVGRESSLRNLEQRLTPRVPAGKSCPALLLTGWPGVGKTTMTAALSNDSSVARAFEDGVLWTSLDQNPNLLREIGLWCVALGAPGLAPEVGISEASFRLGELLRNRRVLLVVDDVWETAHAAPFLVGGSRCAALITTRLDAVAEQLASSPESIIRLPPLDEDSSLELLRSRAPSVVNLHLEECRTLARELEGLPLALHVAGRMLSEESRLWNPGDLIETLREGRQILNQQAPRDRADFSEVSLPTVSVLLARSTERLPEDLREKFALLGSFAPKPATFDLEALKAIWETSDPRPAARALVGHGLLEPIDNRRFWIHALLVAFARSMLEP